MKGMPPIALILEITADMWKPLTLWLSIEIGNPHLASKFNQVSILRLFAEILLIGILLMVSFSFDT